jgi:hypothetical protein
VEVRRGEGLAIHIDPEPCAGIREGVGEASAGERIGQPLSRVSDFLRGADAAGTGRSWLRFAIMSPALAAVASASYPEGLDALGADFAAGGGVSTATLCNPRRSAACLGEGCELAFDVRGVLAMKRWRAEPLGART